MQEYPWLFSLPPLLALLSYILLLGVTFRQGVRSRLRGFFTLFLLSMIIWSFGSLMMRFEPQRIEFWNNVLLAGGTVTMPLTLFGFVQAFLNQRRDHWLWLGLAAVLVLAVVIAMGFMIEDVRMMSDGRVKFDFGPALPVYGTYWIFYVGFAFWSLIQAYRRTVNSIMRNRIRYPLIGMAFVFLGGFTNASPSLGVFPLDHIANLINASLLAYAIFRYQLLDITLVIRKGLLYSIPAVIIGTIYFLIISIAMRLFQAFTGLQIFLLSLIVAVTSAIVAQPLRDRAQYWVDSLFFREKYDAGLMLQRLSGAVASVLDLDRLTNMILDEITTAIHIEKAAFFLKQEKNKEFRLIAQRGLAPNTDFKLRQNNPIVHWLSGHEHALTGHAVEIMPQFKALWRREREDLENIRAELFIPLKAKGELVGVLALGPKLSEETYSQDDQLTLTTLANQTAVAIDNARLFTAEQRRRQEAEALREASMVLGSTLHTPQVLDLLLEQTGRVIPYDSSNVIMIKEGGAYIAHQRKCERYESPEAGSALQLPVEQIPSLRRMLATHHPHVISDTRSNPEWIHLEMTFWVRSWAGAPIVVRDEVIGFLSLNSETPGLYTVDQTELLQVFATHAAIAIQNARLYEQVQRHAAGLEQRVAERTRELTEAYEQLQELDLLKTKFVSDVSHELRTPIANIKLYLHLLERSEPEKRDRYMDVLKGQSDRLAGLIEDVLNLSRLDLSKDEMKFAPVDLNSVVEQVVTAHHLRATLANLDLVFEPDTTLPSVRAERNQLAQVVTNLVTNAINYTPSGQVRVSTSLNTERGQACLEIQDTGMGIGQEDMPHLFDRFYRGQRVGSLNIPGTGLGLAITKEIVDLHGGTIEVESQEGVGSTFKVWLPLDTAEGRARTA